MDAIREIEMCKTRSYNWSPVTSKPDIIVVNPTEATTTLLCDILLTSLLGYSPRRSPVTGS